MPGNTTGKTEDSLRELEQLTTTRLREEQEALRLKQEAEKRVQQEADRKTQAEVTAKVRQEAERLQVERDEQVRQHHEAILQKQEQERRAKILAAYEEKKPALLQEVNRKAKSRRKWQVIIGAIASVLVITGAVWLWLLSQRDASLETLERVQQERLQSQKDIQEKQKKQDDLQEKSLKTQSASLKKQIDGMKK